MSTQNIKGLTGNCCSPMNRPKQHVQDDTRSTKKKKIEAIMENKNGV